MSAGEVNRDVAGAIVSASQGMAAAAAGERGAEDVFVKLSGLAERIGAVLGELKEVMSTLQTDVAGAFVVAHDKGQGAARTLAAATNGSSNRQVAAAVGSFESAAGRSEQAQLVATGLAELLRPHAIALLNAQNGIEENMGAAGGSQGGVATHARDAIQLFGAGIDAVGQYKV